ncbi:MAG: DNA-binding transcriptional regulator [Synoicihabitans sp.]
MPNRPRVALLIETSNRYGRQLLRGIRQWEHENGPWALRLVEQGRGATVPQWLKNWDGDGIIARAEHRGIAQALKATGLPVVDVSAAVERSMFPQVVTDSRDVTALAFEHFRDRGLNHIAYCGARGFRWAAQRGEYFRQLVESKGLELHEFKLVDRSPESELRQMGRWLQRLPKPLGVLACYDIRGQQVLEACYSAGLKVPEDVSVLGVHNDVLLCELCDPPLSSVIPDATRAGALAAELLAALMKGEKVATRVHMIPPLGVATRQSTDIVAVSDQRVAEAVRFIRREVCNGINVADVLRAVPMARTALERKFKESLGCTPRQLIERLRMERVRALLAETEATVAEVAERTGFQYPEYMTVAFRRATGETPREWRAKHRPSRMGRD